MVYNNSFLIVEVTPANNELSVPLNQGITIRFAMDMDVSTITNGTLLLHIINGGSVACTVTYDPTTRTGHIVPNNILITNTSYRVTIIGGITGVKTITGVTLEESKNFEFTTTGTILITAPTNLQAIVTGSKVEISWVQPDQYDPVDIPRYEVYVSTSNLNPVSDPGSIVWPIATDSLANITQTSITVQRDLPSGTYYVYVRGVTNTLDGAWVSTQIYIPPADTVTSSNDSVFEVSAVYPKDATANIAPTTIKILFTSAINMTTVDSQSVYVLTKKKPDSVSILDLMTDYGPSTAIPLVADGGSPANMLSFTVDPSLFVKDNEYTIIVRESIESTVGDALGEAYVWSFTSPYSILFGNVEEIREDIKGYLTNVPDKILYAYMSSVSQTAYDIVSATQSATGVFDSEAFLAAPPRYIGQYVRTQTAYDLLVNAFLDRSANAGTSRTLGDFSIDNSKAPDVSKILAAFRERIKPWLDELHGQTNRGYAKPGFVVKGESGAVYPAEFTKDFKDIQA